MIENIIMIVISLFLLLIGASSLIALVKTIKGINNYQKNQKRLQFSNRLNHDYFIPISVLLYSYNEESKIIKQVSSLLELDYKLYEIIVIDDGSTDGTIKKLKEKFDLKQIKHPIRKQIKTQEVEEIYQSNQSKTKLIVIKKAHHGISDAYNVGLNIAEYPYVTFLKSGITLKKNALEDLMRPILEDENVIVCSGPLEGNNKGFFSRCQSMEYNRLTLQNSEQKLNTCPCMAIYEKESLIEILGFDDNFIGENFELIQKLQAKSIISKEEVKWKNRKNSSGIIDIPNSYSLMLKQRAIRNRAFSKVKKKYKNKSSKLKNGLSKVYSIIMILGIIGIALAIWNNILKWQTILILLISIVLFYSIISFQTWMMKYHFEKEKLKWQEKLITLIYAIFETTVFQVIMLLSNIVIIKKKK